VDGHPRSPTLSRRCCWVSQDFLLKHEIRPWAGPRLARRVAAVPDYAAVLTDVGLTTSRHSTARPLEVRISVHTTVARWVLVDRLRLVRSQP